MSSIKLILNQPHLRVNEWLVLSSMLQVSGVCLKTEYLPYLSSFLWLVLYSFLLFFPFQIEVPFCGCWVWMWIWGLRMENVLGSNVTLSEPFYGDHHILHIPVMWYDPPPMIRDGTHASRVMWNDPHDRSSSIAHCKIGIPTIFFSTLKCFLQMEMTWTSIADINGGQQMKSKVCLTHLFPASLAPSLWPILFISS